MSAGDLVARMNTMSLAEIRDAWKAHLAQDPPQLRTRDLMALAFAYRLQVRSQGEMSGPAKRRMAELGRRFQRDRNYRPSPGPSLKPGSSLVKEWRGKRHEVRVLGDGFSYLGERYGSLSEVALRITGTKWNGLVFFGLKERQR
ncbi:MAG: DUF2924 domain-containing protein [Phenylobacterium sp.]|uniref:DUF2924 domain-containing protein n=1 Tax=Phenylobacterium sp. TaxID=1871053 RepID=UPI002735F8AA|nr:DUF2924 domain-containing protein [Phenylobacterium sp.]MDP3176109.1 DUF2924 domain-containing protein [Phenylobacterium sp.]